MAIISELVTDDELKDLIKTYHRKDSINYTHLNVSAFLTRYEARTKEDLKRSLRTKLIVYIQEFVQSIYLNGDHHQEQLVPRIIINLHPYDFTEEEETSLIQAMIGLTAGQAVIMLINEPYEAITPNWLDSHEVAIMAFYDYYRWIEAMTPSLKETPIHDVVLIAPELNFKPHIPVDPKLTQLLKRHKITPYQLLAEGIKPYVKLLYHTADLFCYDLSVLSKPTGSA